MTSTPNEPRLYDVWLMWVEFPDHPGIGKPRPVVITEVDGDLVSGIVAKITGNTDWDEAGDVPLLDWKAEGLQPVNLIACFRLFSYDILESCVSGNGRGVRASTSRRYGSGAVRTACPSHLSA